MATSTDTPHEESEPAVYEAHISPIAYLSAIVLFLAFMATGQLSGLLTTRLTLTERRVIGKHGLVRRRKINLPYTQILGVRMRQSLAGKLFNYGTLTLTTRDGDKLRFRGICEPSYVAYLINEAAEIAQLGHSLAEYTAEKF